MSTIKYNKLVRDEIPSIIKEDNKECEVLIASKDVKYQLLEKKLQEEVNEFLEDKNIEELADVMEVLFALADSLGYSEDELIDVRLTDGEDNIVLVTRKGLAITFDEKDVRPMGRTSMGVIGMSLVDLDEVVAMQTDTQGEAILVVSEKGIGKRTKVTEFTSQNRGGKGVKCYKITDKTGNIVGAKSVNIDDEIMMITTEGIIIRIKVDGIAEYGRVTSGVKLINLDDGVSVASIAKVKEDKSLYSDEELEVIEETE